MAALIVLAGAALFFGDVQSGRGYGEAGPDDFVIGGSVRGREGDLQVSYRHPSTGQDVEVPLVVWSSELPRPGDEVAIVVGSDPMAPELVGDRFGPLANAYVYVAFALVAATVLISTWWSVHRVQQTVRRPSTTYSMIGVVNAGAGLRRRSADLHLYALDAQVGALPVCSVPLATLANVGFGTRFLVDVKGDPRPLGRVVAATSGVVLWPRRRALRASTTPLPDGDTVEPTPPMHAPAPRHLAMRPAALLRQLLVPSLVVLAALIPAAAVAVATMRSAAAAGRFVEDAQPVVAEVVDHVEDFTVVELLVVGSDRRIRINDSLADDHPIGLRYEVLVDPDPTEDTAAFVAFPYEPIEPIIWGLLPLIAALVWCGHRAVELRRLQRVARRGPWFSHRAATFAGARGPIVTLLDRAGAPVGSVPVRSHLGYSGGGEHDATGEVILAGELGPGSPVALWPSSDGPLLSSRPMRVPAVSVAELTAATRGTTDDDGRQTITLPLASQVYHRRPSELRVYDDHVDLVAPRWFGSRSVSIPIDQIAVHDLMCDDSDEFDADELGDVDDLAVFDAPVQLPYLNTSSTHHEPTIGLYFLTPRPLPPPQWIAMGSGLGSPWRRSDDRMFDGVLLRAELPILTREVLSQAGAQVVDDPVAWWSEHRELALGDRRDEVLRADRRVTWLRRGAWLAAMVALATWWFVGESSAGALWIVASTGALAVALFVGADRAGRSVVSADSSGSTE